MTTEATSPSKTAEKLGGDVSILIVEDSGLQAKSYVKLLNSLGFTNVTCCHKASAALDTMRKEKFQIVFCDWNMPERSGLELLQDVRADANLAQIPFVMLTAHAEKEKVVIALKSGVSDYIVKPPTPQTFEAKIAALLGGN